MAIREGARKGQNDKMNILHYALGFPPYRSGGLTKFCMDLMNQQIREGHRVAMLWPGQMRLLCKGTQIKYRGKNGKVDSFEVINPTPVSYDEGIVAMDAFMQLGDEPAYRLFLEELKPDVLHVHTLMGIHKSLLDAAKGLNIRIVFSTHDFFPICPKVTMFRRGRICESIESCGQCAACNTTALSLSKIRILQSRLYRALKDSTIVKKLRKQHRDNYLSENTGSDIPGECGKRTASDYQRLRGYYKSLVEMADVVHYNSSVTQDVYERYLQPTGPKAVRIPITHADIDDCRRQKEFDRNLRITYLGPASGAKGFFLLREALDRLWYDKKTGRQDFLLNVFFEPAEPAPYMKVHGRYSYSQLERIFDNTDVLIAPSIWNETFGYTVLEALSYGVPVIISGTVGARDILPDGAGIIVENIASAKLADVIRGLTPEKLSQMNDVIITQVQLMTLPDMSSRILKCYQKD